MLFYSMMALAVNAPETNVEKPVIFPAKPVERTVPIPTVPKFSTRPDPVPKGNPGNWANTNDYPAIALRQQIEGTTGFRVTVGPDGRVADCMIVSSSGSSDLDSATCNNVRRRALFEPALDVNGVPTTGRYSNRVRWQIPASSYTVSFPSAPSQLSYGWTPVYPVDYPAIALAEKRQGRVVIELSISSAGAVDGCKIFAGSGHGDLDAQSCKLASERALFRPALDVNGLPTAGRMQTEVKWRIPGEAALSVERKPTSPAVMPKSFLPQMGVAEVSFMVAVDGSITNCSGSSSATVNRVAPDTFCKMNVKFEPYTDASGKPVARRVTIKTNVNVEDVK